MHVITVDFLVHAERVDAFREAVLRQARNSLELEADCHQFDVCVDPAEPRRVYLYEIYTDEAAFQAHLASAHFASFDETVRDWLESKDVRAWRRIEGKRVGVD